MSGVAWKPIVGWAAYYEVSSDGKVRSIARSSVRIMRGHRVETPHPARELRIYIADDGRALVRLCGGGRRKTCKVAHLVAEAFLGVRPTGKEVAHNNGKADDNRLSNLRYASKAENEADKFLHGTLLAGDRSPVAKLTSAQVAEARASSERTSTLARRFGVSPGAMWNARFGKTWKSTGVTQ